MGIVPVGAVENTGEPVWRCEECNVNLAGPLAVREHYWWHRRLDVSEACPYCGQVFYAPPGHDPIRKHVDFCEARPDPEDA